MNYVANQMDGPLLDGFEPHQPMVCPGFYPFYEQFNGYAVQTLSGVGDEG